MKTKIPVLTKGAWPHSSGLTQVVDDQSMSAVENQFIPPEGLLVDFDHYSDLTPEERNILSTMGVQLPSEAAGWIKSFEREGDKIFGIAELTPFGAMQIASRAYVFTSPVFDGATLEPIEEGTVRVNRIKKIALTNEPNIKTIGSLANRASDGKAPLYEIPEETAKEAGVASGGDNAGTPPADGGDLANREGAADGGAGDPPADPPANPPADPPADPDPAANPPAGDSPADGGGTPPASDQPPAFDPPPASDPPPAAPGDLANREGGKPVGLLAKLAEALGCDAAEEAISKAVKGLKDGLANAAERAKADKDAHKAALDEKDAAIADLRNCVESLRKELLDERIRHVLSKHKDLKNREAAERILRSDFDAGLAFIESLGPSSASPATPPKAPAAANPEDLANRAPATPPAASLTGAARIAAALAAKA